MSEGSKQICSSCKKSDLPLHFEMKICPDCLFKRAGHEFKTGNFVAAIELHQKGVEFDLSLNDFQGAELNLQGIALARDRLGDYEIAEELFRACLDECRERGYDPKSEHHYLCIILDYILEKRNYDEVEQICNQLLAIQRDLGYRHEEALTLTLLAWSTLNRENKDLEKSEQLYREAVRILLELNIPLDIWFHKHGYTDPDSNWNFPPKEIPEDFRKFWKYKEEQQFTDRVVVNFENRDDGSVVITYERTTPVFGKGPL